MLLGINSLAAPQHWLPTGKNMSEKERMYDNITLEAWFAERENTWIAYAEFIRRVVIEACA